MLTEAIKLGGKSFLGLTLKKKVKTQYYVKNKHAKRAMGSKPLYMLNKFEQRFVKVETNIDLQREISQL